MKEDLSMKNNKCLLFLLFVLTLLGCNNRLEKPFEDAMKSEIIQFSKTYVGADNYQLIYEGITDSIKSWSDNRLKDFLHTKNNEWKVDSLICLNTDKNKLISVLLYKSTFYPDATQDDIEFLYGVKIKEKWYYFPGPTMVITRPKDSKSVPTSFENLSEIAYQKIFKNYLKPNAEGEPGINEKFFEDLTSVAWYTGDEPKNQSEWDSVYLKIVRDNWSRRDTTDYYH